MVFSSPVFLFIFFPLVWIIHAATPQKLKNCFLLIASLGFYFYGEGVFFLLMILTILTTYTASLVIVKRREKAFLFAFLSIFANLFILIVFKYGSFFASQLNLVTTVLGYSIPEVNLHLPAGISFFTFQAVSCIVDIYRNPDAEKPKFVSTALYISFFPQLIAGPILRYNNFVPQLKNRMVHYQSFIYGSKRFVYGLAKKILIANTLAVPVDKIFEMSPGILSATTAWTGAFLFTLQIYFDFSGYSDMAIGLGRMLGLKIPENFNYPLISKSITEFWRRWHISLSTWFRDYLYIPMGGNRKGKLRMYVALWVVFFVCGLWHGASWNFVIFGLAHGTVIVFEKTAIYKKISAPHAIKVLFSFVVVLFLFVVFRSSSLTHTIMFFKAMFGGFSPVAPVIPIDFKTVAATLTGILFIFPVYKLFEKRLLYFNFAKFGELFFLLFLFALAVSDSSMIFADPFIYFRF
ncbi:MAG: MBOAT family O-acyltransferase [bacterium]